MPHIERMLTVSTGTISQETCAAASEPDWRVLHSGLFAPYTIAHEFGFICYVGESSEAVQPADLVVVMDYARGLGCEWVNFDRDAAFDADLPAFDW